MTDDTSVGRAEEGTAGLVWRRVVDHKVIQWGIAYLGASLAIAQLAEIVTQALAWPDFVWRGVVVILIVGLPIALTVAWYHGHRGLTRISAGELSIVSVLLLIGAVFFIATFRGAADGASPAGVVESGGAAPAAASVAVSTRTTAANSVAVLPFVNNSSDPEQEHFADGLADQLRDALSDIRELRVTGRTSSFYFKGRAEDLRTIGERLGVEYVVEGSVQKVGDRLRITAEVNHAQTGYRQWGDTYAGTTDDIFEIQDAITQSVAEALQITLGLGELGQRGGMTRNVDAYEAFMRGNRSSFVANAEDLRVPIEDLERAVAIDPSFALAWARLSALYGIAFELQSLENDDQGRSARWQSLSTEALSRARDIAPDAPAVVAASAGVALDRRDYSEADRLFRKALESKPDASVAQAFGEFLLYVGKARESVDYLATASRIDPLNPSPSIFLAIAHDANGNRAESLAEFRRLETVDEAAPEPHLLALRTAMGARDRVAIDRHIAALIQMDFDQADLFGEVTPLLDEPERALPMLKRFAADPAHASAVSKMVIATWAAYFGDHDSALALIGSVNAGPGRSRWVPLFNDVRRLPAFKDYMREAGFVDYWRANGWGDFCRPIGDDDFECR